MRFNPRVAAMSAVVLVSYATVALAQQAGLPNAKDQLVRCGVVANLKVKLIRCEDVKGSVGSVRDNGFKFGDKHGGATRLIDYDSVPALRPAGLLYRANGTPDAAEPRRVVLRLGTSHPAQVQTAASSKEAKIASIVSSILATLEPVFEIVADKHRTDVVPGF